MRGFLEEQVATRAQLVADTLRRLGEEGLALAHGRTQEAPVVGDYVRQAAEKLLDAAGRMYDLADDVQSWGLETLLEDLQDLSRRRPGLVLVGTAVGGFAAARFARAIGAPGERERQQKDRRRGNELGPAALDALLRSIWPGDIDDGQRATAGGR